MKALPKSSTHTGEVTETSAVCYILAFLVAVAFLCMFLSCIYSTALSALPIIEKSTFWGELLFSLHGWFLIVSIFYKTWQYSFTGLPGTTKFSHLVLSAPHGLEAIQKVENISKRKRSQGLMNVREGCFFLFCFFFPLSFKFSVFKCKWTRSVLRSAGFACISVHEGCKRNSRQTN